MIPDMPTGPSNETPRDDPGRGPVEADVTVIIPTRDRLWRLPQAVASCRGADARVQIIVADDGSSDGTWEWLGQQPDVLALQTYGWGKPFAVNRAYREVQGRYVRFLDSDDWLPEGAIDRQLAMAEDAGADLVVAGYEIYHDDAYERTSPWVDCDDFVAQQLGECDSSHYSAFTFRRELTDEIPHRTSFPAANFASRDDRCFMIEAALAAPRITVDREPGLCHRHHDRGRLQFRRGLGDVGTNIQHLLIYRQALRLLEQRGELTPRRKRAACNVLWPLAHRIAYTHPAEGADVAAWVHELCPDFRPPEPGALGHLYERFGFRHTERILRLRRTLLQPFQR